MRAAMLAILVAAAVLAGCATEDAPAGTDAPSQAPALDVEHSWALDPGAFGEANLQMPAGGSVAATFSSDAAAVRWDVHGHDDDGNVEVHDRGAGANGTITFTAPAAGTYSILWENGPSSPATILKVRVQGDGELTSWAP